jgi:uncharacterized linocin/CFP29 family protein
MDVNFEGVPAGGATIESGRSFVGVGAGGRWAGERFVAAMKAGRKISPADLRTAAVLRNEEWKYFDTALVAEAAIRLRGVAALIANGNFRRIPNGLAKTVLEYQKISDMDPAIVSMDGVTRSENDRVDFGGAGLPMPITHKDFYLNLRTLMASREGAEALDTTYVRLSGRKVAEETERMLFQGGKTFGSLTIYGLTNFPNRTTASFGTNGNWAQAAKTGENIVADVNTMLAAAATKRFYGPYWLFISANAAFKLGEDYKANSDRTIRQRVLDMDGISQVIVADQLPAGNVILLQPTSDVVEMIEGEPLQTVQWDIHGGFQINFKAFQILVPLLRSDAQNRSGIVHMA